MQFGGLVSSSNAIEADEIEVRPWLVWRHACQHLATGQQMGRGEVTECQHCRRAVQLVASSTLDSACEPLSSIARPGGG